MPGGLSAIRRGMLCNLVARSAAVIALLCGNCGREAERTNRYVPAPELARSAVEVVLADWKSGRPRGPIDRLAVKVHVVDQHRTEGQTLEEFEILGESSGVAGRCFVVRLKYSQPDAEERARYIVIGIDPLWVFRQEDYDMLSHWDHPMPTDAPVDSEIEIEIENKNKTNPNRDEGQFNLNRSSETG